MTFIINDDLSVSELKERTIQEGPLKGYTEDYKDLFINGNLVKRGDPVLVKDRYEDEFIQGYFLKYTDNDVYAYMEGQEPDMACYWRYAQFNEEV